MKYPVGTKPDPGPEVAVVPVRKSTVVEYSSGGGTKIDRGMSVASQTAARKSDVAYGEPRCTFAALWSSAIADCRIAAPPEATAPASTVFPVQPPRLR
jgi:hypothetical protein